MTGRSLLLLVLVLLLLTAAAVILLRRRQGRARAETARREKDAQSPDLVTHPAAPHFNLRYSKTEKRTDRTLNDPDIVTTPTVFYGGSSYAAPIESYDPSDRNTGTREAYVDPSPAADPSPAPYSGPSTSWGSSSSDGGSSSSSSDSGSSGGGSD